MRRTNELRNNNSRFWTGLILLLVGGALLADRMGAGLPHWLLSWPMILILIGLVTGIKQGFRNLSWLVPTLLGTFFLTNEILEDWNMKLYVWPLVIIILGILFMIRPNQNSRFCRRRREADYWEEESANASGDDVLNSVSVFGGAKKNISSKQFKGGEITCFMGGCEINLTQADLVGTAVIDVTVMFGGAKLIIPPHWEVRSDTVSLFAGIEDKRPVQVGKFDPDKVIVIRGTTIFGGIEIKSY
ncbi:LiaF transmembrane domain-containing protein [Sediminibacterium ginsengisoli]|nr:DUF5668 domain-containing protein [Sediminibacterium ginsengisoli]